MNKNYFKLYYLGEFPRLEDGESCKHKGCLNHASHPCEGCGRILGNTKLTKEYYEKISRFY